MDNQHAYRDIGTQASHPGSSYGQQNANILGAQAVPAQTTLIGQIASAHALTDSLGEVVSGLEKRLSPVLSSNYPDGQKDGPAISCDPPAIEEMDRLLNRLRSVIGYIDSIERRARI